MAENTTTVKAGGGVAAKARNQLERQTGKSVFTGASSLPPGAKKALKPGRKT